MLVRHQHKSRAWKCSFKDLILRLRKREKKKFCFDHFADSKRKAEDLIYSLHIILCVHHRWDREWGAICWKMIDRKWLNVEWAGKHSNADELTIRATIFMHNFPTICYRDYCRSLSDVCYTLSIKKSISQVRNIWLCAFSCRSLPSHHLLCRKCVNNFVQYVWV